MARLPPLACLLALCLSCDAEEEVPTRRAKKAEADPDVVEDAAPEEESVVLIDPIEQVRLDALAGRDEAVIAAARGPRQRRVPAFRPSEMLS